MSRPNILLIGIDALRVKNLSCYGYKRPTTPNIDKLAHRGMLFKKAFSVGNQTVPSLIAIFSGCYIGPRNNMWKYDNEWVKLFKKHGYKTFYVGIQSMACYSPLDKILSSFEIRVNAVTNKYPCLKKVMDKFRVGSLPHKIVRKIYETKREITFKKQMLTQCREDATKICNKATTTLGNIRQPFFLFLWFPDLHYPYNPPKEFVQYISKYKLPIKKNISTEEILEKLHISIYKNHIKWNILNDRYASDIINRYDGTLRYIDTQIGIILKSLSEKGLTDDTIIILMADHGESFIEHDIFFEHHGLYDVSIHVPLIIYNPDFCSRKTTDELVQTIDLFPTIAKMVNIDISKIRTDGKDLSPLIKEKKKIRHAIYAMENGYRYGVCVRTKRYKYIYNFGEKGSYCEFCGRNHGAVEELYDLQTDPHEKINMLLQSNNAKIKNSFRNLIHKRYKDIR